MKEKLGEETVGKIESHADFIKLYKRLTPAGSKDYIKDLDILESLPKILSGRFDSDGVTGFARNFGGEWATNVLGILGNLNVARYLGGLGLSFIDDMALAAVNSGLTKRIEQYGRMIGMDGAIAQATREELLTVGFACDRELEGIRRLANLDLSEDFGAKAINASGRAREFTGRVAERVVDWSKIRLIDDINETALYAIFSERIAKEILSGKSKVGRLTGKTLEAIKKELKDRIKFDEEGVATLNQSLWSSKEAVSDFNSEIRRLVRKELIKPDRGDLPFSFRGPGMKLFNMFFSYGYGLTNQVLIPLYMGGHYGKLSTLLVYGFGFGMLRETIGAKLRNDDFEDENGKFDAVRFYKGVLRRMPFGVLGGPLEAIYTGAFGETRAKSAESLAYAALNGGNLSMIWDAWNFSTQSGKKIFNDEGWTEKDIKRFIKCVPCQNLPYIQAPLNYFVIPKMKLPKD